MLPWVELGTAKVPGDGGQLRLMRRGDEFCIFAGRDPLMNSRQHGSEEELARLSWERIATHKAPRLLIGGLGMGFTLRAALAIVPADATVVVAELVPEVEQWARGPMAELFAGCLDDTRVRVAIGDVGAEIGSKVGPWDAILLDVDNGPDGLSRKDNDRLYSHTGLAAARAALRPRGVLAVWSSAPDAKFSRRLADSGFAVEEKTVSARPGGKGGRHTIWIAKRR